MIATFLDFDGVLVDSEPVHLAAFNDVLQPLGIAISEAAYVDRYLSLDDAGVFRAVLTDSGQTLREEQVRRLVSAKSPRFLARFEESFRVFPGAADLVIRRARRGPVAIVSGALEREITFALDRMGVRPRVAFIVSAESTPESKPDPGPFRFAIDWLRRLHPDASAIVVEDSTGGVRAAKGAGLRCIAVTHTYGRQDLLAAGADTVVPDLASLTDAVLEADA